MELSQTDIELGVPLGEDATASPLPDGELDVEDALACVIQDALRRPPCLVSFSGGRDSSVVLASAARLARREGLPLPVPATLRFPTVHETDETRWQELMIGHLGLKDWERIEVHDELDWVGPEASAVLERHGVLWPPNAHVHAPLLRRAAGGTLLTGFDGDGVLGSWRWQRAADVLSGRSQARARDLLTLSLYASPRVVRLTRVSQTQELPPMPWLDPLHEGLAKKAWALETADEPRRHDRRIDWYSRRRFLRLALAHYARIAEDAEARILHPFADSRFLSALARRGRRWGVGARNEALVALFSDIVPAAVLRRTTKARFDGAFWRAPSRRFAREWNGAGIDPGRIDTEWLRANWLRSLPDVRTLLLLQHAWLESRNATRSKPPPVRGAGSDG